ncbi:MAG: SPOR domain-containing protein [Guyparkeria sp.]|uniref:SPOR domain-containing protein n=1 Tax=Guyparkeria sp. TaxID=2035736 RepID=UPI00397DCAE0
MAEQTESSWTESRFRQRLVGASVVVALAVLLLPLWLDGSGIDSLRVQTAPEKPEVNGSEEIEIPDPPGETGEPLENPPTSLFPDQEPAEARTDEAPEPESDKSGSKVENEIEAAALPEEMNTEVSEASVVSEPGEPGEPSEEAPSPSADEPTDSRADEKSDAEPEEESKSASSDEKSSSSENLPESSESGEFVVQLGSFSDERNARALASSVESSGFEVTVKPLFSEQGTVWRVRVGPYDTRELASEATERLRQRIGRDGLVMTK